MRFNQIRQLATKMLRLHAKQMSEDQKGAIVIRLTSAVYSHQHTIVREEAKEIGLPLVAPIGVVDAASYRATTTNFRGPPVIGEVGCRRLLRAALAASPTDPVAPETAVAVPDPTATLSSTPLTVTTTPGTAATMCIRVRVERA